MNARLSASFLRPIFTLPKFNLVMMSSLPVRPKVQSEATNLDLGSPYECEQSLQNVIRFDIIPRLLRSQRTQSSNSVITRPESLLKISDFEISVFMNLCLADEEQACQNYIKKLIADGITTDQLFLELITPAARLLGEKWDQDLLDFTQVTQGLVRLHSITHEIGFEYQDGPTQAGEVRRLLIASAPDSKHFLGPNIVANFFRKFGWQVVLDVSASSQELIHAAGNEWFDLIGISVSTQQQLNTLRQLVADLKKRSRNPQTKVMLGGPIFNVEEHVATEYGADVICIDAKKAVEIAASILA
jgi:methanogenic corrinoid protein MtbC1